MNKFHLLYNPIFRNLIIAQFFSDLAVWIDTTVVGILLVYYWKFGSNMLATYTITLILAFFMGSIFSVLIIDRLQAKYIMLTANFARIGIVIGYIYVKNSYQLLMLIFIKYFLSAFYDPATQKLIRYAVNKEKLLAANSLCAGMTYGLKIFAPFLGASLLFILKPSQFFIFCAILFLVSNLILVYLPKLNLMNENVGSFITKKYYIVKLYLQILKIPSLYWTIIFMCFIVFTLFTCESFYVLLFKKMGLSESISSLMFGFVGIGGVSGAYIVWKWLDSCSIFSIMASSAVLSGITATILGINALGWIGSSLYLLGILFFISGLATSVLFISYNTHVQKVTNKFLIGRVSSVSNAIQTIFMMGGPLFGAYFIKEFGVGKTFITSGIMTLSVGFSLACIYQLYLRLRLIQL